jgi:hypothetical protein
MPSADSMERAINSAKKNALKGRGAVTADTAERLINSAVAKTTASFKNTGYTPSAPAPAPSAPASTWSAPAQPAPAQPAAAVQPVDNTNYSPTPEPSAASQWTLESDPVYQQAIASGQSTFNMARAQALADLQNRETEAAMADKQIETSASKSRERLAGNYASRGMAGGGYGALTRAEAEANAQQITAQTNIKDQISSLSQQYLSKFGATGSDWTGTLAGQDYRNQAIQQAIAALAPKYTAVV